MRQEQEILPPVIPLPKRSKEQPIGVLESIPLDPHSQEAIEAIRKREGQEHTTAEDTVAVAIEVFNVLTEHLSRKDSSVILYTLGESLKTLNIRSSSTIQPQGGRTIEKQVQPPKMHGGR
jgi:threonine synthase